jgi:hypothetical protein
MGIKIDRKVLFTPGPLRLTPMDALARVTPALARQGQFTPYAAFAQFFDKMELRSKFTAPVEVDIAALEDPTPNPALNLAKPAFIFTGPAGTLTVAPYGEVPDRNEALWNMAGLIVGTAAMFGVAGFLLGSFRQKIKARRREHRARLAG